jgi:hypothetical protein
MFIAVIFILSTDGQINPYLFLLLLSSSSLMQRTQAEETLPVEPPKPRLFSLASWIYLSVVVIIVLFFLWFMASFIISTVFLALTVFMGVFFYIYVAVQMSQWTPHDDQVKAEAVAWTIKTQPPPNLPAFQKAVEIAQNSPHLRPMLLEDILPVLGRLIKFIQGNKEEDLHEGIQKIYIALLAVLADFKPCKAAFWRNEAALKEQVLSDGLKEKLHKLREGCCTGHDSPLSGCTTQGSSRIYTS